MTLGLLKKMMRDDRTYLGHYVGEFFTPGIGHLLKQAGCEFVFVDMEHSGIGYETLSRALRYFEAAGLPSFVRVPSKSYAHIARALDVGADGIVIPMLGSEDEANAVIEAMKYTPMGGRGVAPGIGNDRWRPGPVVEGLAAANERTVFVGLIETAQGIANVDAIAALDGIDCLWVGHFDLTCSMGIPGQFDNPQFTSAMNAVRDAGQKNGKKLGRLTGTADESVALINDGWNMICLSGDVWLYQSALRQGLDGIRSKLKDPA